MREMGMNTVSELFRQLTEAGLNWAILRNYEQLPSLDLGGRRLTDLDLRYNRLTDISALASCSMLERVALSFNHRLSDISALESCPRLRRVDVLGTRFSETSAALIGELEARGVVIGRF